jgi:hypothetical protein
MKAAAAAAAAEKEDTASPTTDGPWDVPEDLIFQRVNTFVGRCDDIREFFRLYQV